MKNKKFVHCPRPGCDRPLRGSWNDYLNGEVHPKTGLPVYECPNCHLKFTADAFRANAVPVPEGNGDVVLYDTVRNSVMDIIPYTMKFTDGKFYYVHIPINICTSSNLRCFCFVAKGLSYKEIEDKCKEAIKSRVEVIR